MTSLKGKDYIETQDLSDAELGLLLDTATDLKKKYHRGEPTLLLPHQTAFLLFFDKSTRTRNAFEAGMTQLGGHGSYLSANDIDMGGRESVPDVARNLSRWVQAIAARVFKHATVEELARHADVPVINALSDREHPCQALADLLTLLERYGQLQGLRLAYVGDGNNVCNSLMLMGATLGVNVGVACPPDYRPDPEIVELADQRAAESDATITISASPAEVLEGADAVYTDVWTSMGQEHEAARRRPAFQPYQLNTALMDLARPAALAMHCLPAHRGEEVTAEVIDGPHSVVFDQAENRLHVQKALILTLLNL